MASWLAVCRTLAVMQRKVAGGNGAQPSRLARCHPALFLGNVFVTNLISVLSPRV